MAPFGNRPGSGSVGVEQWIASETPVNMLGEQFGVFQRHPFFGIVFLDVDGKQIIRFGFGEFDEMLGLCDRIAWPPKMVGAPFEPQ